MARKKHTHIHGPAGFTREQRQLVAAARKRNALNDVVPLVRPRDAQADPSTSTPRRRFFSYAPKLPQTLAELGIACGLYHDVAIIDARRGAATYWAMKGAAAEPPCLIPRARAAAWLVQYALRGDLGFPSMLGTPYPVMPTTAEDRATANIVMAAWESAGSPHLAQAISNTHRDITAYLRKYPPAKVPPPVEPAHSPA